MHPSTNVLNEIRLCLQHFPKRCFLMIKDELLTSTSRECSGNISAFLLFLLDFLVAPDSVETFQQSFLTLKFPDSNLSSLMDSLLWPPTIFFLYTCKCICPEDCFSLLSFFPDKTLITSHFKSMHVSIIICHVICKMPAYGPVSLTQTRLQAPLGALVPGIEWTAGICSVYKPNWADRPSNYACR